jgi:hypothetical protein
MFVAINVRFVEEAVQLVVDPLTETLEFAEGLSRSADGGRELLGA